MLNYIWFAMLIIGFVVGIMNGRVSEVTQAVVDSSKSAVEISIGLLGVMCLWTGLMEVAEKSGIIRGIAKAVRPVMKFLFPGIPKEHPAGGAIVMNLVANFLGLGNAATPLGIKAINELQKLNPNKDTATNEMSMFLVLNTACIQFIPATIIALRSAAGSKNPTEIIGTIWVASISACMAGIIAAKILSSFFKAKSGAKKGLENRLGRRKA
ncbi:nucleoside recognition domain-containing protein [Acetivibrio mesophilus]|uniref:Nucleoside recognition protein n=1 Tax=Acetivibrio mesophilus TaxID=2487273 RepID=A0A4V1K274_9FIRM|nr:nucleoside recognition domain-containing protein [Acetivibrio mesophilus]ODM26836.1 nucleoside recognition protein [Clostridium sp. Bc-iso-3]RXE59299.1 nucleoside recognition protein [Acetivibrio mesophilus]HHV28373.1 nucleoside recognition protein [Clostridium sp.]